jgi:hypothetical protein
MWNAMKINAQTIVAAPGERRLPIDGVIDLTSTIGRGVRHYPGGIALELLEFDRCSENRDGY